MNLLEHSLVIEHPKRETREIFTLLERVPEEILAETASMIEGILKTFEVFCGASSMLEDPTVIKKNGKNPVFARVLPFNLHGPLIKLESLVPII